MQQTVPPQENTRADLYDNHAADAGVVEVLAKTDRAVVVERVVRDADTRTLHVYRDAWARIGPYFDARIGEYVPEHWRKDQSYHHEFDLIGDDTDVVKHDGRTWGDYARERFAELMSKRFPT